MYTFIFIEIKNFLGTLELGLGELFEASIDGKGKWYPLKGNYNFYQPN